MNKDLRRAVNGLLDIVTIDVLLPRKLSALLLASALQDVDVVNSIIDFIEERLVEIVGEE